MPSLSNPTLSANRLGFLILGAGLLLASLALLSIISSQISARRQHQWLDQNIRRRMHTVWRQFIHQQLQHPHTQARTMRFDASGMMLSPMHLAPPVPPQPTSHHNPHQWLLGAPEELEKRWHTAHRYHQQGHIQKAFETLHTIPPRAINIAGLPFDLLVPWKLYQWNHPTALSTLIRNLHSTHHPVSLRLLLLQKLQREPKLKPILKPLANTLQRQLAQWRSISLPPKGQHRQAQISDQKGTLYHAHTQEVLWFPNHLLRKKIRLAIESMPTSSNWTFRFVPPSPNTIPIGPLAISLQNASQRSDLWVFGISGAILAFGALMLLAIFSLRRLLRQQQATQQERQRFVTAVSHELRTPLTSLSLTTEMLAQGLIPPERLPRTHQRLEKEIRRLRELVEHVLLFTRASHARPQEKFTLQQIVDDAIDSLHPLASLSNNTLSSSTPDDSTLWLTGEKIACTRVVHNLIDNAIRYAPGSPIELLLLPGPILQIRDHGPGLPEQDIQRLFQPFERGPSPSSDGAGLGLSLVQEVITHMNGSIEAYNAPDGGACFRVHWTQHRSE